MQLGRNAVSMLRTLHKHDGIVSISIEARVPLGFAHELLMRFWSRPHFEEIRLQSTLISLILHKRKRLGIVRNMGWTQN